MESRIYSRWMHIIWFLYTTASLVSDRTSMTTWYVHGLNVTEHHKSSISPKTAEVIYALGFCHPTADADQGIINNELPFQTDPRYQYNHSQFIEPWTHPIVSPSESKGCNATSNHTWEVNGKKVSMALNIRAYFGDFLALAGLLESVRLFVPGDFLRPVVVLHDNPDDRAFGHALEMEMPDVCIVYEPLIPKDLTNALDAIRPRKTPMWLSQTGSMYADKFTWDNTEEYVAITDTDVIFTTYTVPIDLFDENGRPRVIGAVNSFMKNTGHVDYKCTQNCIHENDGMVRWEDFVNMALGIKNSIAEFMIEFPIVIKKLHLQQFRERVMYATGTPSFEDAMVLCLAITDAHAIPNLNLIGNYLYWFHHDEYSWHLANLDKHIMDLPSIKEGLGSYDKTMEVVDRIHKESIWFYTPAEHIKGIINDHKYYFGSKTRNDLLLATELFNSICRTMKCQLKSCQKRKTFKVDVKGIRDSSATKVPLCLYDGVEPSKLPPFLREAGDTDDDDDGALVEDASDNVDDLSVDQNNTVAATNETDPVLSSNLHPAVNATLVNPDDTAASEGHLDNDTSLRDLGEANDDNKDDAISDDVVESQMSPQQQPEQQEQEEHHRTLLNTGQEPIKENMTLWSYNPDAREYFLSYTSNEHLGMFRYLFDDKIKQQIHLTQEDTHYEHVRKHIAMTNVVQPAMMKLLDNPAFDEPALIYWLDVEYHRGQIAFDNAKKAYPKLKAMAALAPVPAFKGKKQRPSPPTPSNDPPAANVPVVGNESIPLVPPNDGAIVQSASPASPAPGTPVAPVVDVPPLADMNNSSVIGAEMAPLDGDVVGSVKSTDEQVQTLPSASTAPPALDAQAHEGPPPSVHEPASRSSAHEPTRPEDEVSVTDIDQPDSTQEHLTETHPTRPQLG